MRDVQGRKRITEAQQVQVFKGRELVALIDENRSPGSPWFMRIIHSGRICGPYATMQQAINDAQAAPEAF